jgi:Polysaccharide lyase
VSDLGTRIAFDNSVNVMQGVAGNWGVPGTSGPCDTVKAEVDATDPQAPGIVNPSQRAAIRLTNPNATNSFYGYSGSSSVLPSYGDTTWYGFAFATNPQYTPHYDPAYGTWNNIFAWHNSTYSNATGSNWSIGVSTIGPSSGASSWSCGQAALTRLAQPRLLISLDGGDVSQSGNDTSTSTCKRILGPVFQPGQRYRLATRIKWDAYQNGSVEVWINDAQYVDLSGISTWWRSGSSLDNDYPIFENYRKYDNTLPANIVYYGGLIRGSTQADVAIP